MERMKQSSVISLNCWINHKPSMVVLHALRCKIKDFWLSQSEPRLRQDLLQFNQCYPLLRPPGICSHSTLIALRIFSHQDTWPKMNHLLAHGHPGVFPHPPCLILTPRWESTFIPVLSLFTSQANFHLLWRHKFVVHSIPHDLIFSIYFGNFNLYAGEPEDTP